MISRYEKHLKGRHAYNITRSKKLRENYELTPKLCKHCEAPIKFEKKNNNFCSHSCSATATNISRALNGYTIKGKTKQIVCKQCEKVCKISLNSRLTGCKKCAYTMSICKPIDMFSKKCDNCECMFSSAKLKKKTCSKECENILKRAGASRGGRISANVQAETRRSKNEIYFAELCKNRFVNVFTNKPMFNGWDADVILPDLNVAVLWNGAWHYKKITSKHSVIQVQNRDAIKIKEITNMGYVSYVIRDDGIEDRLFVEEQFKLFLHFLSEL